MAIKLKWANLRSMAFKESLDKMVKTPMGFELGLKMSLLGRDIQKQHALCNETFDGLVKKFGKPNPEMPGEYLIDKTKREQFNDEVKKLDEHEFELARRDKIDVKVLAEHCAEFSKRSNDPSRELTPEDMINLEPLLLPLENPLASVSR